MTRILFLLISLLITKLSFADGESLDNRINDFFVPMKLMLLPNLFFGIRLQL